MISCFQNVLSAATCAAPSEVEYVITAADVAAANNVRTTTCPWGQSYIFYLFYFDLSGKKTTIACGRFFFLACPVT